MSKNPYRDTWESVQRAIDDVAEQFVNAVPAKEPQRPTRPSRWLTESEFEAIIRHFAKDVAPDLRNVRVHRQLDRLFEAWWVVADSDQGPIEAQFRPELRDEKAENVNAFVAVLEEMQRRARPTPRTPPGWRRFGRGQPMRRKRASAIATR